MVIVVEEDAGGRSARPTRTQAVMLGAVDEGRVRTRRGVDWWLDGKAVGRSHGRTLRELHAAGLVAEGDGDGEWVGVVLTDGGRARLGR